MVNFQSFYGTITMISDFWTGNEQATGCYKLMSMQDINGSLVNFVRIPKLKKSPTPFFKKGVGDFILAFSKAYI